MKKFKFEDSDPDTVIRKTTRMIRTGPMAKIIKMDKKGPDLQITFSQLGTSRILYGISPAGEGFTAEKKSEKIALSHGMFRKEVEKYLAEILSRLGAAID